ncbi:MAG: diguanylate cyclase domain-containing protein [Frankiaceae bacterium]
MRKDDVTHPDDIAGDDEAIRELTAGQRDTYQREKRYFRADGQVVWARVSVALLPDGRGPTGIVHAEDMTTQKRAEKSLARQVLSDALTGLANRTALLDHLRLAIDQLERHPGYVAVLYVDLDRFKPVNDSLGHAAGDVVLRMVAGRLQLAVRGIDTVARVGGDEFVVVCPSVLDDEDAVKVARRIAETISDPIPINGERTVVTASIGIALGAAGNQDAEELMHAADVAMYQAKERGGHRFEIYDRDLADRAERRLEVEHDLRVDARPRPPAPALPTDHRFGQRRHGRRGSSPAHRAPEPWND